MKSKQSCKTIRRLFLPLSHCRSNNAVSGLSDHPQLQTSKPRNHPGVPRMPLQSRIRNPSLSVINESVADGLFLGRTHTTPLLSSCISHSMRPCSQRFRLIAKAFVWLTKDIKGSVSQLPAGQSLPRAYCKTSSRATA